MFVHLLLNKFIKITNTPKVEKAPEPGDIIWENLPIGKKEKIKRRIISKLL